MHDRVGQYDPFVEAAERLLRTRRLLPPRACVIVGVSGGADSLALLSALRDLAGGEGRRWRLSVAHLHHGLRGEADADAEYVAELAAEWRLECDVERRDARQAARDSGRSVEDAARMLRYEFLAAVAARRSATHVAVGHHADDNAETVLYRILRGTHLRGLAGIPASRALAGCDATLIRPLLASRREEVEAFCARRGLVPRIDATNADTRYRRNFIRHELLPLIRERLNPRADEALLRLAAAADEAERLLAAQADRLLAEVEDDPAVLAAADPLVRKYAMRTLAERAGVPMRSLGSDRLAELSDLPLADGPPAVPLPGGFVARRDAGRVAIEPPGSVARAPRAACGPCPSDARLGKQAVAPASPVELNCPGETRLPDGRRVRCTVEPFQPAVRDVHCREPLPGVELLDADQLRGHLLCRPRRDGDAFVPLGAPGRQTVSDFLTNAKLPRAEREAVRCICDDLGLVYLAPLRIDERVKLTAATERVLRIEFPSRR